MILMDNTLKGRTRWNTNSRDHISKISDPILYITAQNDKCTMEKMKNSNATGVMTKPSVYNRIG
jgi:hypothetical protein